jgi:hypothetical protein
VAVLKKLADRGLTARCVLANLHHRRITPLMERRLCIFEKSEDTDPLALAESRLLRDPFLRSYAASLPFLLCRFFGLSARFKVSPDPRRWCA